MDNDKILKFDRLFKLETMSNKLVIEGKRDPEEISNFLQKVIERPVCEKFCLVDDLGTIVVPDDYKPGQSIEYFYKKHPELMGKMGRGFFTNCQPLFAKDKVSVKIYANVHEYEYTSLSDRIEFLARKYSLYPGVPGMYFIFLQKNEFLKEEFRYTLVDEEKYLKEDHITLGEYYVPTVCLSRKTNPKGVLMFEPAVTQRFFGSHDLFFGFNKVK